MQWNNETELNEYSKEKKIIGIEGCQTDHFQLIGAADYLKSIPQYKGLNCISLEESDIYIQGEKGLENFAFLEF